LSCRSPVLLVVVVAVVAGGCSGSEPGGPQPQRMQPSYGPTHRATAVQIIGASFNPLVKADYNDKSRATVSTAFAAHLGGYALEEVLYVDAGHLKATVPAGLAPGHYDLTVVDPRGRRGVVDQAFWVKQEPADGGPDRLPDGRSDTSPDLRRDIAPADKSIDQAHDIAVEGLTGPMVSTVAGIGAGGFQDGAALTAQFFNPVAVLVSGTTLYVGDFANHRIRVISGGVVSTLAGSGTQGLVNGPALGAAFNYPAGMALDGTGGLLVVDSSNDVIRLVKNGAVSTLAGSGLKGFLNGPVVSARFNFPRDIALAGSTIYIADTENHRIRAISSGLVSTLAGSGIAGFLDGAAATARFNSPSGLALSGGTLYVADAGNDRIRAIALATGAVTTIAGTGSPGTTDGAALSQAQFWQPLDLVASGSKLYIADQANHRIRKLEGGVVSTVSGSSFGFKDGPLPTALFFYPSGLALGAAGQLYVADQSNHRIRMISF